MSGHFVQIGQQEKMVQLVIYETKTGNLEGVLRIVIGKQGGHLQVKSKSYKKGWFFLVSHFLKHKEAGNFLIISVF